SQRGKVLGVQSLSYEVSADQVGQMYAVGINALWNKPNKGVLIYGNKTLQVTPSSTDRLNVRREFLFLRASIMPAVEDIIFEANADSTWRRLDRMVGRFMDTVQADGGLFPDPKNKGRGYKFVVDTTPEDIDANRLVCNLYVKPTKDVEYLKFNLISTSTGTSF